MSHACVRSFHFILLEIKLEQGLVTVLDSRRKDPQDYADMTQMLKKLNRSLSTISATLFISWYQVIVLFVRQGLEKIHQNSSGTAEGAGI